MSAHVRSACSDRRPTAVPDSMHGRRAGFGPGALTRQELDNVVEHHGIGRDVLDPTTRVSQVRPLARRPVETAVPPLDEQERASQLVVGVGEDVGHVLPDEVTDDVFAVVVGKLVLSEAGVDDGPEIAHEVQHGRVRLEHMEMRGRRP